MTYAADPGGVFASDTHRRVLGHLPVPKEDPMELQALGFRISGDAHHGLGTVDELHEVLKDLEADGYATETAAGWRMTKKGLDALNDPGPDRSPGETRPALLGGLETGGSAS